MNRLVPLVASIAMACAATQAFSAEPAKTPVKKPVKTAKAAPAKQAAPAAAAEDVVLTQAQLDIAPRVFTGRAECEFNQTVTVDTVQGKPGLFKVAFGGKVYTMAPQETTTGAVRLEDRSAGALWLQIPAKSMLIDTKAGHRLVDACRSSEQRVAQTN